MTSASMSRTDPGAQTDSSRPGDSERGIAFVTGLAVVLVLAAPLLRTPSVYDEGFALVNALRIGDGQLPYLDFWTVYTPGEYYLLAGLFRVFGEHVLVARLSDVALQGLFCWQVYALVRPRTGAIKASVLTILVALFIAVFAQPLYPVMTALLLSLAALRVLVPALGPGGTRFSLAVVGALAGTSGWFRQDSGAYGVLMVVVVTVAARLTELDTPGLRARLARLAGDGAAVAIGVALAFALLFVPWAIGIPPDVLLDQLVVHPTSVLQEARHLPLPGMSPEFSPYIPPVAAFSAWLYFYAILALAMTAAVVLTHGRRMVTDQGASGRAEWLVRLGLLALLLPHIAQMVGRYDMPHALPSMTLAMVLGALLLVRRGTEAMSGRSAAAVVAVTVLIATWPVFRLMGTLAEAPPWRCADSLPGARCVNLDPDEMRAVRLLQERTSPGDPLFVGNIRHDKVWLNDALFYFLAKRPVATRYHEYSPLVTDTLSVQQEMIRELERQRPPWVVLVDITDSQEENASSRSSGILVLDDWIREHYVPDTTVGAYQLWRLKDG